ncbi:MAG TPA: hypothetical protein VKA53_02515, partial [Thermoanaerobaculia bacterium]|nr:hypothetical protein [Thermoanaerobaculia bacterium]
MTYDATNGYLSKLSLRGTDGTSTRVLRAWSYDTQGRVIDTWRGADTATAGVDHWSFAYDSATQTTATDPLSNLVMYTYAGSPATHDVHVMSVSGDCPMCTGGPNQTFTYGDSANPLLPTQVVDGRGIATAMDYAADGEMTSKTEDANGSLSRTTSWTYDSTYPSLVDSTSRESVAGSPAVRETDWTYDGSGNPTARAISGSEAGSGFSYETDSTFNTAGKPLTVDPQE